MLLKRMKFLQVTAFSLFLTFFAGACFSQDSAKEKEKMNPGDILMEHVLDSHEFHIITIGEMKVTIPLPIILYSSGKGLSVFMSSQFHHGETAYDGYRMIDDNYLDKLTQQGVDTKKNLLSNGKIIPITADDNWDASAKVYDFSMTRNVVQMLLALALLIWIMLAVAGKYKKGIGVKTAPTGFQNAIEPVITFIRDEVGKPMLGDKWEKYMPYLLTVFFFILINNLIGLIPGTANVTGNIAFTAVLGVIAFVVIIFSSNKHYWGHIFNPPGVPGWVKIILVPVEILGVFTKPFALIIRLFANMIAGHMMITCLVLLIFIFGQMNAVAGYSFSPVSIAFCVFVYFIEILVAFLQAFIFTMLTAVFISQAFEIPHGHEHDHADSHHTNGYDDAVIV
jgi:F-type H+-transporting ATPase subunit a